MSHTAINELIRQLTSPVTLVDVGARGGVAAQWEQLGDRGRLICFEADAKECERLNGLPPSNAIYVPYALADHNRGVTLHITVDPACSSTYLPKRALFENLSALSGMRPLRTIYCPSITLDDYCEKNGIESLDAIKLDTQGSELDILSGSVKALSLISLIDIEVAFNAMYEGQALFGDIDRFLRDHGFVLWRLNHLAFCSNGLVEDSAARVQLSSVDGQSYQIIEQDNGQLIWGDAHYVRREFAPTEPNAKLDPQQAVKAAIVIGQQGHWDLAIEILRKSGDFALHGRLASIVKPRAAPTPLLQQQLAEAHKENKRLSEALSKRWSFGRR